MKRCAALAWLVLAVTSGGCATFKPMISGSADVEDYRAFRVAGATGTRLARAQKYLARHPKGAFADEVRAVFEEEEPRFFERSQATQEGVRRYLADLPDGPHAVAAIALLTALGSNMQDAELRDIARRVRYEDAKLESAAVQRRAIGESILGAIGVLLDEQAYGVPRAEGPPALRTLMTGRTSMTWGTVPRHREEDLYFLLPTRPERESRLFTLEVTLAEQDGVVTGARIEGADMMVLWAEADQIVKLDPSVSEDRTEAQVHAMDRLGGAFERRFPQASCPDARADRELYHRACDGWEVVVLPGDQAGAKDAIIIRGRPGPARKPGDR
ncbi:MAG: hypothetical protein JWO86_3960 [Myxococcaceae bacterium]|nr:hypothetical protein [Myxococcaceae bacterium]MEA2747444.1 hypothetical protein [Myxococcales bacterium]